MGRSHDFKVKLSLNEHGYDAQCEKKLCMDFDLPNLISMAHRAQGR